VIAGARVVDGIDIAATITADRDPASPQNWVDATGYEIRR
jgi:plasmid replication initiation protein